MKSLRFVLSLLIVVVVCSGFSNAKLTEIQSALIEEDYPKAQKIAKNVLSGNPDQSTENQAKCFLGLTHIRLKQFPQAQEVFSQLKSEVSDDELKDKVYLGLFDSYYMNEQYDKAQKAIRKLTRRGSKSSFESLILLKAARVHLKKAEWAQARNHLKRIVSNYPDSLEFHTAQQLLEEKQYFAVQVGAFIDQKLAEKLAGELKRKGEYAYIVETRDKGNKKFYRVRVGQLALLNEARILKSKLASQGYPARIYP